MNHEDVKRDLEFLSDVLKRAQENVERAKRDTGFLENNWRIHEAELIRDKAQIKYNDALKFVLK